MRATSTRALPGLDRPSVRCQSNLTTSGCQDKTYTCRPAHVRRRGDEQTRQQRQPGRHQLDTRPKPAARSMARELVGACAAGRCPWPAGRSRNRRRRSARRRACRPSARPAAGCRRPAGRGARRAGAPAPPRRHGRGRRGPARRRRRRGQRVGAEVAADRPWLARARPARGEAGPRPLGHRRQVEQHQAQVGRARRGRDQEAPSPPPTSSRQRWRASG